MRDTVRRDLKFHEPFFGSKHFILSLEIVDFGFFAADKLPDVISDQEIEKKLWYNLIC